jgi:hypothetical protein
MFPKSKQLPREPVKRLVRHLVAGVSVPSDGDRQTFASPSVGVNKSCSVPRVVPLNRPRGPTTADRLGNIKPLSDIASATSIGSAPTHIGADPDILVVEDIARILRCTVDTARRIPRDQLRSICGPGRRRLYLREDVLAYVRSLGRSAPNAELLLTRARAEVLGSSADRVRGRSQRRRTS